jgi:hypothetical protein
MGVDWPLLFIFVGFALATTLVLQLFEWAFRTLRR